MTPILHVQNVHMSYDNGKGVDDSKILTGVDVSVNRGDFVCILGPSGCGKTTLLRCIAGFEDFDGEIFVNGDKKMKPDTDRIVVFQDFNQLFSWKTVEKNVQYPLQVKGIKDKKKRKQISDKYLEMVGLKDYATYYPHQLSGGMKQRVAIARSLALKPELVLMDEPFASLDAMTRRHLQGELMKIHEKENCTVIFITHNIQEALMLGTRILLMNRQGKVELDMPNPLNRPVTPASEGFGEMWEKLSTSLEKANEM